MARDRRLNLLHIFSFYQARKVVPSGVTSVSHMSQVLDRDSKLDFRLPSFPELNRHH